MRMTLEHTTDVGILFNEPNFEDAILACQRYWLSELRSSCKISSSLGSLSPGSRAGTFKLHQKNQGADCKQGNQATRPERVME